MAGRITFSARELHIISMVRDGKQSKDVAAHYGIKPSNASAAVGKICDKLGFKDRIQQLREYDFEAKAADPIPAKDKPRNYMLAAEKKDLLVKIRHRDGDGCFYCQSPINFSTESRFLEHGPSICILKEGVPKYTPVPDENKKLAHRACNPTVTVKDRTQVLRNSYRKYRENQVNQVKAS